MSAAEEQNYFFLDTNVLVYLFDPDAPAKQAVARRLLEEAVHSRRGTISTQVVQEFVHLALRKFQRPMTIAECREYLQTVLLPLCQHFPSISTYDRAMLVMQETGYTIYDALIVTAAIESGCNTLLTEDLHHGRVIQSVRIINPFLGEAG